MKVEKVKAVKNGIEKEFSTLIWERLPSDKSGWVRINNEGENTLDEIKNAQKALKAAPSIPQKTAPAAKTETPLIKADAALSDTLAKADAALKELDTETARLLYEAAQDLCGGDEKTLNYIQKQLQLC